MPIESGRTLAHYRLVEQIGEGGMGVVWKAVDTNLDREVAVKILPDVFSADALRLARFEREAKLLALINHPNIATVYGLHEQDGLRFLAMELIPGQDLAHRLSEKPLPLAEALPIARQIAAALEATHERGVIHRDLKPPNVYLTPAGDVKVLDFGIARDIEPDDATRPEHTPSQTEPGTILGTVSYMSPEQARGKPLDPRTDLWSLGCVIYRMLAGKQAFVGETRWDRLAAVLREEPDWDALPGDTPDAIRHLLESCLVKDLEQRLGDAGEARRIIENTLALMSLPGQLTAPTAALPLPAEPVEPAHRSRSRFIAAFTAIGLVAAAIVVWQLLSRETAPGGSGTMGDRRSIAVLPFESLGGGEENAAFTAGIHDDILNRVAKIGDLKVISRTSVMEYGAQQQSLKRIGEELGVATVLEGAVRRSGDQVRINVQLIDVETEESLWAERYNREVSVEDIFAIQSDIAERVGVALQVTLSPYEMQSLGRQPTANMEAYDLYLRGTEYFNRAGQLKENLVASKRMFEQAVALDPDFALAYAGLSRAARDYYWMGGGTPGERDEAVAAAERAVQIAPDLPEAHLALGTCFYVRRDYDRALEELSIAEKGLPGNSELIRWKSYILRRRGKWDEAVRNLERAKAIDPRDPEATMEVGLSQLCMRRYEEAERNMARALSLAPDYPTAQIYSALAPVLREGTRETAVVAFPQINDVASGPWKYAHGWQVLLYARDYARVAEFLSGVERVSGQWHDYPTSLLLGWTYLLEEREEDAARELEKARSTLEADAAASPEDARIHMSLGLAYAGLGRKEDALRTGRHALELLPVDTDSLVGAWLIQDMVWIYAMTGEPDQAVETLDTLLSMPSVWSIEALLLDPRIDSLRERPAFHALVRKHQRSV